MKGPFTGKHMLALMVGGFGVVIAVNMAMATLATTTFGGVVVENSYVASQHYNEWLDRAERSRALGWSVNAERGEDGALMVLTEGVPTGAHVIGVARHPLGRQPDVDLGFVALGEGRYRSVTPLPPGRWTLRMQIEAASDVWRGEEAIR